MTKSVLIQNLQIGSGMPKICVPLTKTTQEELLAEAAEAKAARPDLVEWRADFYEDLFQIPQMLDTLRKIAEVLAPVPLLFTIRTKHEGGNVHISAEDYAEINLQAAMAQAAAIVDVEIFWEEEKKALLIPQIRKNGTRVIASSHNFKETGSREYLLERFRKMNEFPVDILKMAVMPQTEEDVAAIMQVTKEMTEKYTEKPVVSMSMGTLGAISRIQGEGFGSAITFVAVGAVSAPGQFPIEILREKMKEYHRHLAKNHE